MQNKQFLYGINKKSRRLRFGLLFILLSGLTWAATVPVGLRCEMKDNPIGIDTVQPRLSWEIQSEQRGEIQTAWQILAADSAEILAQDKGILWDSGRIGGNRDGLDKRRVSQLLLYAQSGPSGIRMGRPGCGGVFVYGGSLWGRVGEDLILYA